MAAKFYTGIDLCNQELLRAKLHNTSVSPDVYAAGMVYYDNSTTNNTKGRAVLRSASSWEALAFLKDLEGYTTTGTHSALVGTVNGINNRLKEVETIFNTDNDNAINKWNEVVAFLAGIEGGTLDSILDTFATKATTISAGTGLTGTIKLDGTGSFGLAASGVTAGTYPKVTVDKYGRVTAGSSLAESDIPALPISKITNLQTTIAGITGSIAGFTDLFTDGAAKRAIADKDGKNIANTYATKADLSTTNANVTTNANAIDTLKGYFTNGIAKDADKLDGKDSSHYATAANLGELATKVTANANSITTLTGRINDTDGVLSETIVRVTAAEGDISALKQRVTAAEGNITTLMEWYDAVGRHFKYDSGNKAWYLNGDFYTTGQNAAGEAGSASEGGGSGSGIILNYDAIVDALGYAPAKSADLTNLTNRVTTLEGKATSVSYTATTNTTSVIGVLAIDGTNNNITLRSANVTSALGYTPASNNDVVNITNRVSILEKKSVSYTASPASSAVIGSIVIDGTNNDITLKDVNVTSALGYTPTRKMVSSITANGSLSQTITHNLNTRDVTVQLFMPSGSYEQVYADVKVSTTNSVTITFAETPTTNYRVVIIG